MISESLGGRAARRGPDGRSAGRRCAGRPAAAGRTAATGRFRRRGAAKSGPMLRGPERFSRSSALAVPIPGTKAAPIYIAFWRSSYASGSSRARPSSARSSEPRRARRKEGRERTLCRETMLRTPPPPTPPRKLFLPPSEFTAGGQESKPRGSRGLQDRGGCGQCKLFEVITLSIVGSMTFQVKCDRIFSGS